MSRRSVFTRFGFSLVLALGVLAVSASAALATAPQVSHVSVETNYEITDVCSFAFSIDSHADILAIHFFDKNGALIRIYNHVDEQDTFSANGKTLVGLQFPFDIEALYAKDGTLTSLTAVGVVEKVRLPDGRLFLSAGFVDYLAHPDEQFILTADRGISGNVPALCAALS
jgi:hypothetical protein